MRNRGVGGVLVALWVVVLVSCFAHGALLYLNEEPLSFSQPIIQQGASLLVPLEETSRFLGLAIADAENGIVLRGPGFRQVFELSIFTVLDGTLYVALDWMANLVGGQIHLVGGDTYLETARQRIEDVEASASEVTIRLTGFSFHQITRSRQGLSELVTVSWPHSQLSTGAQLIRVGESDIQAVRILEGTTGVELTITLEPETVLAIKQLETAEFYSLTFRVAETETFASMIEVDDGMAVHEWESAAEQRKIQFVYVEAWRDRFRLKPTVPTTGYPTTANLQDILLDASAVASVSMDCAWGSGMPECLIIEGIPYSVSETPSEVLAIDLFGRWSTFSSLCSVNVKHAGQLIHVDGVNRALEYGETVLYSPGYAGTVARGIPGSFTAIKIRENRVVSVYQGPFVPTDSSALLLVASGEAKAKLAEVRLGDPMEVVCQFVHANGTYPYALSAGPSMMTNGMLVSPEDQFSGGAVLASDWQGGLYLLIFNHSADVEAGESGNLGDILRSLPTTIKDAVLLSFCGQSSLAYATPASGSFQLGSLEPVRLALSLIPLTP